MIALDSGRTVVPEASIPVPVKPKLTAAEVKDLKAQFSTNYPGELLTPGTTRSLPFLSYVKECVDTKTSDPFFLMEKWPWRTFRKLKWTQTLLWRLPC